VAGFLLGWSLGWITPVDRLAEGIAPAAQVAGTILIAFSVALGGWAMIRFLHARTAILPIRPAARLVQCGPYRFTRNPMYLSMTLLYVGLALVINHMWPLLFLPVVLLAIRRLVIAREERHLLERFGSDYEAYRKQVPRWIGRVKRG
jgi:protein-S-isoprenylcysteine O-methyltransferase Ste14